MPLRLAALALVAPQANSPVPPPIVTLPPTPARQLLAWMPGAATCGGRPVAAVGMRRPYLALTYPSADTPKPVEYGFRLDAAGRPLSIARTTPANVYVPFGDDIGPSLAASRFVAGGERNDCRISYTARRTSYAETSLDDLISYTLNPIGGRLPREGWAAIFPASATCDKPPRPAPLTQVFPDFDKVAGTPGVRDWTMLAYDLDAAGAPTGIRVLSGTGNAALDAAGAAALAASRYTNGPKTGCRFPYYRAPAVLAAPDAPEKAASRPAASTCPRDIAWIKRPPLRYPEPYRRRSIEGWAMIAFDVAPWGGTGAIKVLASEPSADFGVAASQLIREGTITVSDAGFTGCVERVRFLMGKPGQATNSEDAVEEGG